MDDTKLLSVINQCQETQKIVGEVLCRLAEAHSEILSQPEIDPNQVTVMAILIGKVSAAAACLDISDLLEEEEELEIPINEEDLPS